MSACPDDADPELLAGILNHENEAELLLAAICADDRVLAIVYAIVNDRDRVLTERDQLRSGLDTILDGLVGLDSDDAYVAITMEHLNVVRAMLRKAGT